MTQESRVIIKVCTDEKVQESTLQRLGGESNSVLRVNREKVVGAIEEDQRIAGQQEVGSPEEYKVYNQAKNS